eukprot:UN14936
MKPQGPPKKLPSLNARSNLEKSATMNPDLTPPEFNSRMEGNLYIFDCVIWYKNIKIIGCGKHETPEYAEAYSAIDCAKQLKTTLLYR